MMTGGPDVYGTLLGNYINYDMLYAMSKPVFYDSRSDTSEINIFIDLNSFLKRIWDPRPYSYKTDNVLVASIINACAHYRNYFWTRHMVKTRIYLVWGYNLPSYQSLEYNAHFRERVAIMKEAQELLDMTKAALEFLCPYLPQIYFIDGDEHEVAATIYTLAFDNMMPNIVLTRDVYAYQLVAYCPNTFVYRPKKQYNQNQSGIVDNSWVVTKTNLFRALKHEMDYKVKTDKPNDPRHLGYVFALSGMRKRHVKGIMTFNRACSVVMAMEEERPESFTDPTTFEYTLCFDVPDRLRGIGFRQSGDLVQRYKTLDVIQAANVLKQSSRYISITTNAIQDLYNPQAVMEINDKEYIDYPLELMEL